MEQVQLPGGVPVPGPGEAPLQGDILGVAGVGFYQKPPRPHRRPAALHQLQVVAGDVLRPEALLQKEHVRRVPEGPVVKEEVQHLQQRPVPPGELGQGQVGDAVPPQGQLRLVQQRGLHLVGNLPRQGVAVGRGPVRPQVVDDIGGEPVLVPVEPAGQVVVPAGQQPGQHVEVGEVDLPVLPQLPGEGTPQQGLLVLEARVQLRRAVQVAPALELGPLGQNHPGKEPCLLQPPPQPGQGRGHVGEEQVRLPVPQQGALQVYRRQQLVHGIHKEQCVMGHGGPSPVG